MGRRGFGRPLHAAASCAWLAACWARSSACEPNGTNRAATAETNPGRDGPPHRAGQSSSLGYGICRPGSSVPATTQSPFWLAIVDFDGFKTRQRHARFCRRGLRAVAGGWPRRCGQAAARAITLRGWEGTSLDCCWPTFRIRTAATIVDRVRERLGGRPGFGPVEGITASAGISALCAARLGWRGSAGRGGSSLARGQESGTKPRPSRGRRASYHPQMPNRAPYRCSRTETFRGCPAGHPTEVGP